MGSKGNTQEILVQSYCDEVYTELAGMRLKILTMTDDLSAVYGDEATPFSTFKRHLEEIADQIEWKLQILSHACPYEWKGSKEKVESIVSVQPGTVQEPEFSAGYLGG